MRSRRPTSGRRCSRTRLGRRFYRSVRLVTTALKTDFVTLLDLELPEGTIGDND